MSQASEDRLVRDFNASQQKYRYDFLFSERHIQYNLCDVHFLLLLQNCSHKLLKKKDMNNAAWHGYKFCNHLKKVFFYLFIFVLFFPVFFFFLYFSFLLFFNSSILSKKKQQKNRISKNLKIQEFESNLTTLFRLSKCNS